MVTEVSQMVNLTIGKVAKRAKVKIETIRYYERYKLLPEPIRSQSGYRQYSEDVVKRLRFIKNAKELGFSLKEISELFSLRVKRNATCANVKKRTDIKIMEVNERIEALKKIKGALVKLSKSCKGDNRPTSECPILDEIDKN